MASYEKRGKYWSVRFRYINADGQEENKRLSKDEQGNRFETKKNAEQAYVNFMQKFKSNTKSEVPKILYFKDLYEKFKEYRKLKIRGSSYTTQEYDINKHILPYFNDLKLNNITPLIINEWQASKEKYSYKFKSKLRNELSLILKFGQKYYGTVNNIPLCDNFTKSSESHKEMQIWTPEEFKQFINIVDKFKDKVMFSFLYYMGTRKGEMGALRWKDIDLVNKICIINKTLTREGASLKIGKTKNSKIRKIAIPDNLNSLLIELKQQRELEPGFNYEWFVFGGETHLTYNPLTAKYDRYIKKAQGASPTLKRIRIHDFRHSHVSLLINKGSSTMSLTALLYAISERIGDTVEQVLKTYGHLFPNTQQDLMQTLNNLII